MSAITFILNKSMTHLMLGNEIHPLPPGCMAVITGEKIITESDERLLIAEFNIVDLQQLQPDINSLLLPVNSVPYISSPLKLLNIDTGVLNTFSHLKKLSKENFLHFAYVYCLSQDRDHFSALFYQQTSGSQDFCDFIEKNFRHHYCVTELAEKFGLSVRKFNQMFQDIYGVTAKNWLLKRRIEHAKMLLSTTSMRIIDVALECGFSHHAHFTYSFRRFEQSSPSEYRKAAKPN